jgi:ComF family protein
MKRALYVTLGAAWRSLTAALLPSVCALCGARSRDALCPGCARCLADPATRCPQCGIPVEAGAEASRKESREISLEVGARVGTAFSDSDRNAFRTVCGRCIARAPAFDTTVCVADYVEPADSLAIALKFHGQLALATLFGSVLAARIQEQQRPLPDIIVPVPLSSARLASRGYNQAWEIARVTARRIRRPAQAQCLVRTRDTRAQSGLRGADRWRNMRRAFVVAHPERVRGAHVGLVDDVMTSGATLDAAARALKRAGAVRVTVFAVLRTPTP